MSNVKKFNQLFESEKMLDGNREIISWKWRTGRDTIGFVAVKDNRMGYWMAYIGVGDGNDEMRDAKRIADYGTKLSKEEAVAFFPELADMKYKHE
jgi:hypothetical protein